MRRRNVRTVKTRTGVRISLARTTTLVALTACLLLILMPSGLAQLTTTGTINGTITDKSGAVIPQANIAITNTNTGVAVTTVSNSNGGYSQVGLQPGTYTVTVTMQGFSTYNETNIYVGPASTRSVNAALSPGAVSTSVDVSASATQVQTTTGALSNQVTEEQVSTLPLNGRSFQSLAPLMAGVSTQYFGRAQGTGGFSTTNTLSVNGMGPSGSFYTVDGIWDMESGEFSQITVTPNPDEIEQVQVLQNNYDSKYNLIGASVVIVQTKSGTSAFHGNAWEYIRNTDFAARNYFAKTVPVLHWNIFGWDLGGPVFIPNHFNADRKKLFFYYNQQFVRQDTPTVEVGATPTADMRTGVFPTSGPFGGIIKDPTTGQPFPDNTIPQSRINKNSVLLLNAFAPLPNNAANGFLNYVSSAPHLLSQLDNEAKADYNINSKLHLTTEYFDSHQTAPTYESFVTQYLTQHTSNHLAQVQLAQTLSPSMVNQTSFAMNSYNINIGYNGLYLQSQVPGFTENLPYPNNPFSTYLPLVTFGQGYTAIGANSLATLLKADYLNLTLSDDWSAQRGKHFLEAGGAWMWGTNNQYDAAQAPSNGQFSFSGLFTGNSIADFLLGDAASFSQGNTEVRKHIHYPIGTLYFEDHYKATRNFTVSAGLRVLYEPWPHAQTGVDVAFDPSKFVPGNAPIVNPNGTITPTPNYNPQNGLIFNGENGVPANLTTAHQYYLAPIVGFAWDVFGNGRTSLRGGYSINYLSSGDGTDCSLSCTNYPVVQNVNLINVNFPNPSGGTAAPLTLNSLVTEDLHNLQAEQFQTFSLSLEHQVGKEWFFSVAGAGNLGRHITMYLDENQPKPEGGFDFNPLINTGTVNPFYFAPYQGWGNITQASSCGVLNWSALELSMRHPIGHGVFFTAAYTWSHELTSSDVTYLGNTNFEPQNSYNPNEYYGNSELNIPQLFTASLIYRTPWFQKGRGWKQQMLGGWQYSLVNEEDDGFSTTTGLSIPNQGLATHPDQVGKITRPKKFSEWFNTAAFAAPAPGHFGNLRDGQVLSPGLINFDMALYKTFPIREGMGLEFRAEMFNAFNHTNPIGYGNTYGLGNFGQIASAKDPRIGEFAIRLNF